MSDWDTSYDDNIYDNLSIMTPSPKHIIITIPRPPGRLGHDRHQYGGYQAEQHCSNSTNTGTTTTADIIQDKSQCRRRWSIDKKTVKDTTASRGHPITAKECKI